MLKPTNYSFHFIGNMLHLNNVEEVDKRRKRKTKV